MAEGTDEQLLEDFLAITKDAQQSGKEVHGVRMQLANRLSMAAWAAPAARQTPEDGGQTFPHSPGISGSDRTQLRGWIAELQMVI